MRPGCDNTPTENPRDRGSAVERIPDRKRLIDDEAVVHVFGVQRLATLNGGRRNDAGIVERQLVPLGQLADAIVHVHRQRHALAARTHQRDKLA